MILKFINLCQAIEEKFRAIEDKQVVADAMEDEEEDGDTKKAIPDYLKATAYI